MSQSLKNYPCKLALVEDQLDILDYLKDILSNNQIFQVVATYNNSEDAITFLPKVDIQVVLMDIGLPGQSGITCVKKLKPLMPNTQFMMYTIFEEDDKVFESLKNGASGYILKSDSSKRIIQSILELHQGGSPMSPLIARKVVSFFNKRKTQPPMENLSLRENQVLSYVAEGLLYKEIAQTLNLSTGTIKQHIHRIYQKLHVQNRTEATNLFFKR